MHAIMLVFDIFLNFNNLILAKTLFILTCNEEPSTIFGVFA